MSQISNVIPFPTYRKSRWYSPVENVFVTLATYRANRIEKEALAISHRRELEAALRRWQDDDGPIGKV